MRLTRPRLVATLAALLVLPLLGSCSTEDEPSLVIYNAQHQELIDVLAASNKKKAGIDVELRNGSDLELANQLVEEGDASPADVFLTENSPAVSLVDGSCSRSCRRRPWTGSPTSSAPTTASGPASRRVRRFSSTTPTSSARRSSRGR